MKTSNQRPGVSKQKDGRDITSGQELIYQLHKQLYTNKTNKLDSSSMLKINELAEKIKEKKRNANAPGQSKGTNRVPTETDARVHGSVSARVDTGRSKKDTAPKERLESSSTLKLNSKKKTKPLTPHFLKLLETIFGVEFLREFLFDYLSVREVFFVILVNRSFRDAAVEYFPFRLKEEALRINTFIETNVDLHTDFMTLVDSQIPTTRTNWLLFDIETVLTSLASSLEKQDITHIKSIKRLPDGYDIYFAPVCKLFGLKQTRVAHASARFTMSWYQTAMKLFADKFFFTKLQDLDKENLTDDLVMELCALLDDPLFEEGTVMNFNKALGNLIQWLKVLVSYHIIIHPYKTRDPSTFAHNPDVIDFADIVDAEMNHFYRLKRELLRLNIIPRHPNYAFHLCHFREQIQESRTHIVNVPKKVLSTVLFQFLDPGDTLSCSEVCKKWKIAANRHWQIRLCYKMNDIQLYKYDHAELLYKKMPLLFEENFYSCQLHLLDDFFNKEESVLSKSHLDELKALNRPPALLKNIYKSFCLLLGENPERKPKADGSIELHFYPVIRKLLIKKELTTRMKNLNIYKISPARLVKVDSLINSEENGLSVDVVRGVSSVSCQLLIWIKAVVLYHKLINPFIFTSEDYIHKRFEAPEIHQLSKINIKLQNFMRLRQMAFIFDESISMRDLATAAKELIDPDVLRFYEDQSFKEIYNIDALYVENSDKVPPSARPIFLEKILSEFFILYDEYLKRPTVWNLTNTKAENYIPSSNKEEILYEEKLSSSVDVQRYVPSSPKMSPSRRGAVGIHSSVECPPTLFAEQIFMFLDINDLVNCSAVNVFWNQCYKMHVPIRVFLEFELFKEIEEDNRHFLDSLEVKRNKYYDDYEMETPSEENSALLLRNLSHKDISILKVLKIPPRGSEDLVAPFVLLFGKGPTKKRTADSKVSSSYWATFIKMINSADIISQITNFKYDVVPSKTFRMIETYIELPHYTIEKARATSQALGNLVSWILGIFNFHRFLRKYSVSDIELAILETEEVAFAKNMDKLQLRNYYLAHFARDHCSDYHDYTEGVISKLLYEREIPTGGTELGILDEDDAGEQAIQDRYFNSQQERLTLQTEESHEGGNAYFEEDE